MFDVLTSFIRRSTEAMPRIKVLWNLISNSWLPCCNSGVNYQNLSGQGKTEVANASNNHMFPFRQISFSLFQVITHFDCSF